MDKSIFLINRVKQNHFKWQRSIFLKLFRIPWNQLIFLWSFLWFSNELDLPTKKMLACIPANRYYTNWEQKTIDQHQKKNLLYRRAPPPPTTTLNLKPAAPKAKSVGNPLILDKIYIWQIVIALPLFYK